MTRRGFQQPREPTARFHSTSEEVSVIARLNRELVTILKVPEVKQLLLSQGAEAAPSTPEELGSYMKSEFQKWSKLVAEAHLTGE